jgi:hypothetical protein
MGGGVIGHEMVDELQLVAADVLGIAADHRKCLACHCYREAAEEAVGTLDLVSGHGEFGEGAVPAGVGETAARLRDLLASAEGTHG